MNRLNYRIYSVSSESSTNPASNLLQGSSWSTKSGCSWPQQLTIQFYLPIRTKSLRLKFHQYKIPHFLELFVRISEHEKYRKLGFIIPNDNKQSNYEHQEIKTLFFEFDCTFIKIILHSPYSNEMNIMKQCVIENIQIQGELFTHQQMRSIHINDYINNSNSSINQQLEEQQEKQLALDLQNSSQYNSIKKQISNYSSIKNNIIQEEQELFHEIYKILEKQKKIAVQIQDFQKASRLKNIVMKFRNMQQQLVCLQGQKKKALKEQNYDKCHLLKKQIVFIKGQVKRKFQELMKNQLESKDITNYDMNQKINRNISKNHFNGAEEYRTTNQNLDKPTHQINHQLEPQLMRCSNDYDSQIVPALRKKMNKQLEQNSSNRNKMNQNNKSNMNNNNTNRKQQQKSSNKKEENFGYKKQSNKSKLSVHKKEQNYQQQKLLQQQQYQEYQNQHSLQDNFEEDIIPLDNKFRRRVQHYFDQIIPQKLWQYALCPKWKAKLYSVEQVTRILSEISGKQQYICGLQFVSLIITDSHPNVIIAVLHLFEKIIESQIEFKMQHIPYFVDNIIETLLSCLIDSPIKIRQLAYQSYLFLGEISFLSLSVILNKLMKYRQNVKPNHKLIYVRISLMISFVEKYIDANDYFQDIMKWSIGFMQSPNKKVREEASKLLTMLALQNGQEEVINALSELRPQIQQSFLMMLNASMEASKLQQSRENGESDPYFEEFKQVKKTNKKSKNPQNFLKKKFPQQIRNSQNFYDNRHYNNNEEEDEKYNQFHVMNINDKQSDDIDLAYSQQSMMQKSKDKYSIPAVIPPTNKSNFEDQIYILPCDQLNCDYCFQKINQSLREHLLSECKVIAYCQQCDGRIYIREMTDHLLHQCGVDTVQGVHLRYQKCNRCGLAFDMNEINQHVGQGACRLLRGQQWQRCQFCSEDILADDNKWVQHALKCNMLPTLPAKPK